MANVKISQLPALTSLSGTDVLPVVSGNVTYNVTAADIAALGSGSLVNGNNSFVLNADGSVVFTGDAPGNAVNRGMEWDFGADNGGINSTVRQDNAGLSIRAWTEDSGNYAASVNIVTNQNANVNTWIFSGNGDMLLAGNLVVPVDSGIRSEVINSAFNSAVTGITTGVANVIVTIAEGVFEGPFSGTVTISGVNGTTEADGVWGYEAVEFDQFQLFTDDTLTTPVNGTSWTAYISGGTAAALGTYEDLSVQGGNINVGSNNQNWTFDTEGNLNLPAGGTILESTYLNAGSIQLRPNGGTATQYLEIAPTAVDGDHVHLMAGSGTELFLGDDNQYVKLANTGAVVINSNDNNGNIAQWTFDVAGNITLPGNSSSINYANGAPYGGGGGASTGDITFVNTTISAPTDDDITIQALYSDGLPSSTILLSPQDTYTRVQQWSNQNSESFNTADWDTGTYIEQSGQGAVVLTDAQGIIDFVDSLQEQNAGQIYFSVNGGPQLASDGFSGGGGNITFYTPTLPATNPTTVTTFEYFYSYRSLIEIDYDAEEFNIEANNVDLVLRTTGQGRIELLSDNNLSMQGKGSVSISSQSTNLGIDIRTDATSLSAPAWLYGVDGSLALATVNNESAQFVGTRRIIGGLSATAPYSVTLAAGGTPTVAYTSLSGTNSVKVTFVTQSGGSGFQWEQFDVVAVPSQDIGGTVNFVVSNRVKSTAGIADTVVTATMNTGQIEISLTLDAAQTSGGTASFDAVEFGLMVD